MKEQEVVYNGRTFINTSMYIIYKLTNTINNKIYFGYTGQTLPERFRGHCWEKRGTVIARSIKKYGADNFTQLPMCECEDINDAKFLERFLIFRHQTNIITHPKGNGMNMTDGGEGCQGYHHSPETKTKIQRNRRTTEKQVYQCTHKGHLIAIHKSAKCAGESVGAYSADISKCCRGIIRSVKGFFFSYTSTPTIRDKKIGKSSLAKITTIHDADGTVLKRCTSIAEAQRFLQTDRSNILRIIRNGKLFRRQYHITVG